MRPRGVLLFAVGARYLDEARIALRSVEAQHPGMPLVVLTDRDTAGRLGADDRFEHRVLDGLEPARSFRQATAAKLTALRSTPFDRTLYLDCDTYACGPFVELFDVLDRFDMAMSIERRYRDEWPDIRGEPPVPTVVREYNQGVIAYRSTPEVFSALAEAADIASRADTDDQVALRTVLHRRDDLRVATLTQEYNCRFHAFGHVVGRVSILHGRPFGLPHTAETLQRIATRVNSDLRPRVYAGGSMTPLSTSRWGVEPDLPGRHIRLYPARRARLRGTLDRIRRRAGRLVTR